MFIGKYNKSVILTYLGIAFSVAGISLAFAAKAKFAVICLIAAGICDLFDGTVARRCKRTQDEKRFGVQIDSLCDVVDFLVLPVAICIGSGFTAVWQTAIFIVYILAGITRLGYFNIIADSDAPVKYYSGLPVTYSALIFSLLWVVSNLFFKSAAGFVLPIGLAVTALLFVLNIKIPKPGKASSIVFAVIGAAAVTAMFFINNR